MRASSHDFDEPSACTDYFCNINFETYIGDRHVELCSCELVDFVERVPCPLERIVYLHSIALHVTPETCTPSLARQIHQAITAPSQMALICAITHEGILIGWKADNTEEGLSLELQFAFKAHAGPIQTILSARPGAHQLLLCGCSDGAIELFDVHTKASVGQLLEHKAGVTAIDSHGSHLLSGDASGALVVWRCHDWTPLTKLKGHTRSVNSISVHPSGRVALSVGDDKQLFLWDLVKGRQAHQQTLDRPAQSVRWVSLPSTQGTAAQVGSHYEVVYDDSISLYDGSTGKLVSTYTLVKGSRIRCYTATLPASGAPHHLVGLEGGGMAAFQVTQASTAAASQIQLECHEKRTRCVSSFTAGSSSWTVTAGTDGLVKVWPQAALLRYLTAHAAAAKAPEPAATLTAAKGFRITGMATVLAGAPRTATTASAVTAASAPAAAPPAKASGGTTAAKPAKDGMHVQRPVHTGGSREESGKTASAGPKHTSQTSQAATEGGKAVHGNAAAWSSKQIGSKGFAVSMKKRTREQ